MPTVFFPKSPWVRASRPRAVPPVGKAQKHMMEVPSGKKADALALALAAIGEVCARQAFRNLGLARFLRMLLSSCSRGERFACVPATAFAAQNEALSYYVTP